MKGSYALNTKTGFMPKTDIYADKSAVILHWLITDGQFRKKFNLREVSSECCVSLGLTQKVFQALIGKGYLKVSGLRTSKSYRVAQTKELLQEWTESYKLLNKKRIHVYSSGLTSRQQIFEVLEKSKLSKDVALALHSATDDHGRSNTNLQGVELYLLDPKKISNLIKLLLLEPKERGYDVLIVEPFYKAILKATNGAENNLWQNKAQSKLISSPPLLTYLDLFHYPLRGQEAAEHLQKTELKRFFSE